jgi:hypothetical protein
MSPCPITLRQQEVIPNGSYVKARHKSMCNEAYMAEGKRERSEAEEKRLERRERLVERRDRMLIKDRSSESAALGGVWLNDSRILLVDQF